MRRISWLTWHFDAAPVVIVVPWDIDDALRIITHLGFAKLQKSHLISAILIYLCIYIYVYIYICIYTSSTAQGGGGSFKNRKPIGEIGCCESGMAERIHWWTERCLRSPLFLSLSLTIYLPTNLSSMYLSIYRSIMIYLSLSFSLSSNYLSTYLPIYLSLSLSFICLSV